MKKYLAMLMLLLAVTVYFKDGSVVAYDWGNYYMLCENWNKLTYLIYEKDGFFRSGKTASVPAENVLRIEKT